MNNTENFCLNNYIKPQVRTPLLFPTASSREGNRQQRCIEKADIYHEMNDTQLMSRVIKYEASTPGAGQAIFNIVPEPLPVAGKMELGAFVKMQVSKMPDLRLEIFNKRHRRNGAKPVYNHNSPWYHYSSLRWISITSVQIKCRRYLFPRNRAAGRNQVNFPCTCEAVECSKYSLPRRAAVGETKPRLGMD